MAKSSKASIMALHRWLIGMPTGILIAALACLALNIASDLGNSFGDAPHFGGPLVAWCILLAFLATFVLGVSLTTRTPGHDITKVARVWFRAFAARYDHVASLRRVTKQVPWRMLLIYGLALWGVWTALQSVTVIVRDWPVVLRSAHYYGSDELYYAHYNAWLVLRGRNPYVGDHLAAALHYFHVENVTLIRRAPNADPLHPPTPTQRRTLVEAYLAHPSAPHPQLDPATTHSYPALSFLLAIPSVWAGLPSLGIVQVLALLALIGVLIGLSPPIWRPAIAVLCLLDVDGIRAVASSDFAIWTTVGIALVWLLRARPLSASIALGAVCAVQQTAWFAAPFYLIWVWRMRGVRAAFLEGVIAVGAFVALNLPWIIMAPRAWFASLFLPMTLPLYPDGGGLIGIALSGALSLWPPFTYMLLEVSAWLALLILYARRLPTMPLAGIVLPLLPILLAWRSPSRYFILLPFSIILVLVLTWRGETTGYGST